MKNKILAFILLLSAFTPTFAEKIEEKDLMAYLFVYFTGNPIHARKHYIQKNAVI